MLLLQSATPKIWEGWAPKTKPHVLNEATVFCPVKVLLVGFYEELDLAGVFLVKPLCFVRKLVTSSRVELFLCQVIIPVVLKRHHDK